MVAVVFSSSYTKKIAVAVVTKFRLIIHFSYS